MFQAIARAIGIVSEHETAHRFLTRCCGMDANPNSVEAAKGTYYNASKCLASVDKLNQAVLLHESLHDGPAEPMALCKTRLALLAGLQRT